MDNMAVASLPQLRQKVVVIGELHPELLLLAGSLRTSKPIHEVIDDVCTKEVEAIRKHRLNLVFVEGAEPRSMNYALACIGILPIPLKQPAPPEGMTGLPEAIVVYQKVIEASSVLEKRLNEAHARMDALNDEEKRLKAGYKASISGKGLFSRLLHGGKARAEYRSQRLDVWRRQSALVQAMRKQCEADLQELDSITKTAEKNQNNKQRIKYVFEQRETAWMGHILETLGRLGTDPDGLVDEVHNALGNYWVKGTPLPSREDFHVALTKNGFFFERRIGIIVGMGHAGASAESTFIDLLRKNGFEVTIEDATSQVELITSSGERIPTLPTK